MNRSTWILIVFALLASCNPKMHVRLATADDIIPLPKTPPPPQSINPCYNPLSYVAHPELIRMKYIRVNFHFMNSTDGLYNMPESEVNDYAQNWIMAANYDLERNMKMFLPHGNETPVLPIPYRYMIYPDPDIPGDDGIYYHVDDTLCYTVKSGRERNISDKRVIKKYAVRDDSVLNIFVQTHHLDSIISPTYSANSSGISLGSSVKVFGNWFEKPDIWFIRGITNHEIGHTLGLSHTWGGHDGCDDTPAHPNCWNVTDHPPCDSLYSNNMMDYNAHQAALTPCQIGKVLMNMTRLKSIQRNMLEPRWCALDTSATITIADSVRWEGSVDLEGNVVIEDGGVLEIGCRVSLPADATIRIYPGGQMRILSNGILHNSCEENWGGIELLEIKKTTGKIFVAEGGTIENTPQFPGSKS